MTYRIGERVWRVRFFVFLITTLITVPLWAQRQCCEGDVWLKWSNDHRKAYVEGAVAGYVNGFHDGCQTGTADWPQEVKRGSEANPMTKCTNQGPDYSRGLNNLVNSVSEFYLHYPKDRDIYILEVLEQLGKGLTPEQIHNHPFMRHRSSEHP